jgi:hypothetical protein
LRETITIRLKTFYGQRNIFKLEVNINDKLADIVTKLCIEEDTILKDITEVVKWTYNNQYRLFTTIGKLKELSVYKSYRDENIGNDALIVLLPVNSINFSDLHKGHLIYLDNNNRTSTKQGGDEHQIVLTEQGYSIGKNYCEVILDTEPYERSVIVGVSLKRNDFNLNPNDVKGFWGFVLSDCKKVTNNAQGKVELTEYGDVCKMGDRVGILVEFTGQGVDISFYINKINMGVAFKSLPQNTYYPGVALGFDSTKVRITNKVGYPDI